ncbi:MAG: hypothetical protein ACOYYJ_03030 [Chloroflexota bacterium]
MSRTVGLALAMALFLSACIPGFPLPGLTTGNPSPDAQASEAALAATLAIETLNAFPAATQPPADAPILTATRTKTKTPLPTPSLSTTPTASATVSGTPATDTATATVTGTLATASLPPTGTPATGTPATPTATETLHPRFYGTQPPAIPSGKIVLLNRSKSEVYVSLRCTTLDGNITIIEYPVGGKMRISAPAGRYTYVAWVGGRKFEGRFNLAKNGEISMTFEKKKVKVH